MCPASQTEVGTAKVRPERKNATNIRNAVLRFYRKQPLKEHVSEIEKATQAFQTVSEFCSKL